MQKLAQGRYNLGLDNFVKLFAIEMRVTKKTVYNWLNGTFEPRRTRKIEIRAAISKIKEKLDTK